MDRLDFNMEVVYPVLMAPQRSRADRRRHRHRQFGDLPTKPHPLATKPRRRKADKRAKMSRKQNR